MDNTTSQTPNVSEAFNQMASKIQKTREKERGGCLTLYLMLSTFAIIPGIIGLYLLFLSLPAFNTHLSQIDTLLYNSFYLSIVGFILYGIGLIGAWKWKKWGILLMVATSGLLATTEIIYGNQLAIPVSRSIVSLLVSSGILFIAMKEKWRNFR